MSESLILAFDFGSQVATAAVANRERVLAALGEPRGGRDADLLPLLDRVLRAAGVTTRALTGVVALAGPGSFTGVRVACATAQGLARGFGIPARGLSTLAAIAMAAPAAAPNVFAVVNALRDEWFVQRFHRSAGGKPAAVGEPELLRAPDCQLPAGTVVGEEAEAFVAASGRSDLVACRPESLAAAAALTARGGLLPGSEELLRRPLYLRPPALRRPG